MRNGDRTDNAVETCLKFFTSAMPDPNNKNFTTQVGCHFEEVVEMLDELTGSNEETSMRILMAKAALSSLADHLKSQGGILIRPKDRVAYLDALCDQMVTAIGCAHVSGMDIVNGFDEVNRSNLSKFDDHGQPIFNENKKVMKSDRYSPANLSTFV